jgi:hypothetical protein
MGDSRLGGTLLAINGAADPPAAATNFLVNNGFSDGDFVRVTGNDGFLGTVPVIFMTDVQHAALPMMESVSAAKKRAKKPGKKKVTVKRTAAKKAAKKAGGKKKGGGSKKTTKPVSRKSTGKRTGKGAKKGK